MKKFIKNNLSKILIALTLCLTLVLAITFTPITYAAVQDNNGYEILPNGIQSKNLLNEKRIYQFQSDVYRIRITLNSGTYTLSCNNSCYLYLCTYDFSSVLSSTSGTSLTFTITQNNTYGIQLGGFTDINSYKFMLNSGSIALNYYPYGFYSGNNEFDWNEDVLQQNENLMKNSTTALYNALNGAYAELIGRNGTILASGNCILDPNDRNFEIGNLPQSFSDYYHNYDSENVDYYTRPDIKIYLNYTVTNSLLFSFNDTALSRVVTLQNTNNTNNVTASNGDNDDMLDPYTLIINKENIGYNIIYYSGIYIPDYWQLDFNISFDAYTYSQGFTKGVESLQTVLNIERNNANYYKRLYEDNNQIISTLQQRIDDLQEQVNENFGFKNIFFAMADTPFKTVSNFLGFELFGVDLFQAFIGFITVLACIWLIKKLI